ncbi:hypothetical protein HOLleu_17228 [Holothuria leucospilota]|uniref:Uncharacterized protein n=1 Tax=Holothuria leucospilota TaxID=206669 RepID=A0A9Q1C778_HOLLE|nr:hypothetical protein HOLleu_17228 [Holothuria leucospilota]
MTLLADTYRKAHRRYSDRKYEKETDKQKHSQTAVRDSEKEGGSHKFQRQSTGCYVYGKRGHLDRDCDKRFRRFSNDPSTNRGASLGIVGEKYEDEELTQSELDRTALACKYISKPLEDNKASQVISLETGYSTVVVKKTIVDEGNLTGKMKNFLLLDGTIRELPGATSEIDTPFYVGKIEALCIDAPLYGLVLGNIPDIRNPWDPDIDWKYEGEKGLMKRLFLLLRRAQRARKKTAIKPLKLCDAVTNREEIRKAQAEEPTLKNVRKW